MISPACVPATTYAATHAPDRRSAMEKNPSEGRQPDEYVTESSCPQDYFFGSTYFLTTFFAG